MAAISFVFFLIISISVYLIRGDIYMHNPRGSNNRLNAAGTNRRNANRLFDSQNNAKGGYNVGNAKQRGSSQYHMGYFMSGSTDSSPTYLNIEWTNQHGCGDEILNCNIVLQYMCQEDENNPGANGNVRANRKRNGFLESTVPYRQPRDKKQPYKNKSVKDGVERRAAQSRFYGVNEPWAWYDKCYRRNRNRGLFTAGRLNSRRKKSSRYTRQNSNGRRYGYECPEERDYYPYWHPSDWIDIAVLANNKNTDCNYYKKNSFNKQPKGECMEKYKNSQQYQHASAHNNKQDCEKNGGEWVEFSNYLEKAPQFSTQQACENAKYIWAHAYRSEDIDKNVGNIKKECLVPLPEPDCLEAPSSRTNHLGNGEGVTPLTYKWKLPHFPSGKQQRCVLRIRYNISTSDPEEKIKQNPQVEFLDKVPLQLAINTAQFGRTFQDRSHVFQLVSRTGKVPANAVVHNINVRGKRGNIVQAYPAVEYDYVPKRLVTYTDELIHIQWTGSNSNPGGNAGQGRRGTDRNNFVVMENAPYSFPVRQGNVSRMLSDAEIVYACEGGANQLSYKDIEVQLASSGFFDRSNKVGQRRLNDELDNASPSFCGVVLKFTKKGEYYYMCTRNNNFTNRSQKGRLTVREKGS